MPHLTIFSVLGKLTHMQSIAITRLDKGKRNVNEIDCKHQGTKAFPNRLCSQSKSLQTIATGSKRAYVQKCKSTRAQKYKSTKGQLCQSAKCALVDWQIQEEEFASSEPRESLCEAGRGATYAAHR